MSKSAPLSDVYAAFASAYNLNGFNAGRHIVRDHRGWRIRDIQMKALWLASIAPSFDPTAYLMVVHTDAQPRALFCFKGADGLPIIEGEPQECPGLNDRVAASLKRVDLFPHGGGISLDGIGYTVHVRATSVSADLEFLNPRTESLQAVANSLFSVAESIAGMTQRTDMADYLKIWRRYLGNQQPS